MTQEEGRKGKNYSGRVKTGVLLLGHEKWALGKLDG